MRPTKPENSNELNYLKKKKSDDSVEGKSKTKIGKQYHFPKKRNIS